MSVISFLQMLENFDDEITVGEIRHELDMTKRTGICKHCQRQLVAYGPWAKWCHSEGSRSCRSASFDPDEGWDESLGRCMATPA